MKRSTTGLIALGTAALRCGPAGAPAARISAAVVLAAVLVMVGPASRAAGQEAPAMSLQQAVAAALEQNPRVSVAANAVRSSEVALRQVQSDQWTTLAALRRALGLPVVP